MKSILSINPHRIELNALLMQPTRWCGLSCTGCYVKKHAGSSLGYHTPWEEQWRLFVAFYRGAHWANQITISIDDLPQDPTQRHHMIMLTDAILSELETDSRLIEDRPEVHMTLHSPDTLRQYFDERVYHWTRLSMISFSELNLDLESTWHALDYFRHAKTPVNYNKLVHFTTNFDKEIRDLEQEVSMVDHCHLVMNKRPIGSVGPRIPVDGNYMQSYSLYISEVVDNLNKDARDKISFDSCLLDVVKHSRSGFGCSANISKFQVWPDGSVSGCPYAFRGITEVGKSAASIVENIYTASKRYEFREDCHLRDIYSSLNRRPESRLFQI